MNHKFLYFIKILLLIFFIINFIYNNYVYNKSLLIIYYNNFIE